jgi:hypothetical protein
MFIPPVSTSMRGSKAPVPNRRRRGGLFLRVSSGKKHENASSGKSPAAPVGTLQQMRQTKYMSRPFSVDKGYHQCLERTCTETSEISALCQRYSCSRSVVSKLTQALAQALARALQDRLAMSCLLGVASRLMSHEARFWLFIYYFISL